MAGALLFSCSKKAAGLPATPAMATPAERANYLKKILHKLCTELGPRPIWSEAYQKGAVVFEKEFRRSLSHTEIDKFTFEGWTLDGPYRFLCDGRELEIFPSHGCPGTGGKPLTGNLKTLDEKGNKFALTDPASGETLALITMSKFGKAVPRAPGSGKYQDPEKGLLPQFDIGKQDLPILKKAIAANKQGTYTAKTKPLPDSTGSNVVGTLPGKTKDEILFLAHLDTVYNTPGANDNTASAIALIMLAHTLKDQKFHHTLRFVATGAEEFGELGAIHYAERRKKEGTFNNIKYVFNFDSLTYGLDLQLYSKDQGLKDAVVKIYQDLGLEGTPKLFDKTGFALDATPFKETGALALYVNSRGENERTLPLWHRPEDTADSVRPVYIENPHQAFAELVRRIEAGKVS